MKETIPSSARNYLDNIQGLIVVLTENGSISYMNAYAARLLGSDPQEIRGLDWFEHFIPYPDRKSSLEKFHHHLAGERAESYTCSHFVVAKNGTLHLIEWTNRNLQNGKEKMEGLFCFGEDITEKYLLKMHMAEQQVACKQEKLRAVLEATEKERKYLANELHDGVNQVLTTCKLLLESEVESGRGSPGVQRVSEYLQEVIMTLRDLAHELNPADLDNDGLYEASMEMISRINASGKMNVQFTIDHSSPIEQLPSYASHSLFRIMQEALTNTIKHAEARNVSIHLISSGKAVDLEIRDDGRGFDRKERQFGLGLKTIYNRAEASGGKAFISSYPGQGTLLSVHIPLGSSPAKIGEDPVS